MLGIQLYLEIVGEGRGQGSVSAIQDPPQQTGKTCFYVRGIYCVQGHWHVKRPCTNSCHKVKSTLLNEISLYNLQHKDFPSVELEQ